MTTYVFVQFLVGYLSAYCIVGRGRKCFDDLMPALLLHVPANASFDVHVVHFPDEPKTALPP